MYTITAFLLFCLYSVYGQTVWVQREEDLLNTRAFPTTWNAGLSLNEMTLPLSDVTCDKIYPRNGVLPDPYTMDYYSLVYQRMSRVDDSPVDEVYALKQVVLEMVAPEADILSGTLSIEMQAANLDSADPHEPKLSLQVTSLPAGMQIIGTHVLNTVRGFFGEKELSSQYSSKHEVDGVVTIPAGSRLYACFGTFLMDDGDTDPTILGDASSTMWLAASEAQAEPRIQNTIFSVPSLVDCPTGGLLTGDLCLSMVDGMLYKYDGSAWAMEGSLQGPQGVPGVNGTDGLNGTDGAEGPQGPPGVNGTDGAEGPVGPEGPPGVNGTDGAQGPRGWSTWTGTEFPPLVDTIPGDSFLNSSSGDFYFYNGTAWELIGSMKGQQGDPGPQGDQGPIGPQGPQGIQGPQGDAGPQGAQGPAGATGPQGPQGVQGVQGPQGVQGDPGPAGSQGPPGATGPQGPPGSAGAPGPMGYPGVCPDRCRL